MARPDASFQRRFVSLAEEVGGRSLFYLSRAAFGFGLILNKLHDLGMTDKQGVLGNQDT